MVDPGAAQVIGHWRPILSRTALVCGVGLLLHAAYIPLKARLAQYLLEDAWDRRLAGELPVRPWPWADMTPLARLRQPRLGVDQVVLDGASGRVLAFGPGHVAGSARPGDAGNVVISGHRDTHFRWLGELNEGDLLIVQAPDGRTVRYSVAHTTVHHESETDLLDPYTPAQLRLITCYPFDAVDPGTPWRFVVTARREPL